jgi:surfactin family lipopeptide synthetase A/fengycin family lipopeptide synthetase D
MPHDNVTGNVKPFGIPAVVDVIFGETLTSRVHELGRQERTTPSLVMLALYAALVSSWCKQKDFVLLFAVNGRLYSEHVKILGLLALGIPLRIELEENNTFTDLLRLVSQELLTAYEHLDFGNYSCGNPETLRGTSINWKGDSSELAGIPLSSELDDCGPLMVEACPVKGPPKGFQLECEILCGFEETPQGIHARVNYRSDLFTENTMQRFVRALRDVTEHMMEDPYASLASFQALLHRS